MAVRPAARGDEAKVAAAVQKLLEEDQTLSYVQNPATNEMILSGLGEQHLTAVVSKLKEDFGVEVVLSVPKIAYRETIRKKVKVQGKYKKQSGGHGQYGDVWSRIRLTSWSLKKRYSAAQFPGTFSRQWKRACRNPSPRAFWQDSPWSA